jgi:hypothetical protein
VPVAADIVIFDFLIDILQSNRSDGRQHADRSVRTIIADLGVYHRRPWRAAGRANGRGTLARSSEAYDRIVAAMRQPFDLHHVFNNAAD